VEWGQDVTKLTKNQLLIIGVILLLIIGGLIWSLLRNSTNNSDNALNSQSNIKIADTRAISPCQALPETSVAKIYGQLGPKSYIDETYYSSSISEAKFKELGSAAPNEVQCRYLLDDAQNSTVTIKFEQFASAEEAAKDWQQAASYSKVETNRLLNILDSEIPNAEQYNLNPEKLRSASEALRQAVNAIDDADMSQVIDGAERAILYAPNRNGFLAVSGNKLITLSYEFGSVNIFDHDRQVAPGEIGLVIGKIKSSFDTIFNNIKNPNLSQAPSPTLRGAMISKIGEAKILDACEVLSNSVAMKAMDVSILSPVTERVSIRKDISTENSKSSDKPVIPTNSCKKDKLSSDANKDGYVSLDLYYLPNKQQASEYLSLIAKKGRSNEVVDIQTNASKAQQGEYKVLSSQIQFVNFQQGPYAGKIVISRNSSNDTQSNVSRQTLQAVTNLIVEQIAVLSK
jgi:hypothetical protein